MKAAEGPIISLKVIRIRWYHWWMNVPIGHCRCGTPFTAGSFTQYLKSKIHKLDSLECGNCNGDPSYKFPTRQR